ncbi:MAG: hypothetical protein FJ388_26110 [Verrucomicrobia bacterium]|nr:hypothetical protein [Verrucomicrobiota bacterium]
MTIRKPSSLDRALARVCAICPICHHARKKQRGAAFEFVKKVETHLCPFCAAYARVHGRKSHEPAPRGPTA